jgi:hypothetical protein
MSAQTYDGAEYKHRDCPSPKYYSNQNKGFDEVPDSCPEMMEMLRNITNEVLPSLMQSRREKEVQISQLISELSVENAELRDQVAIRSDRLKKLYAEYSEMKSAYIKVCEQKSTESEIRSEEHVISVAKPTRAPPSTVEDDEFVPGWSSSKVDSGLSNKTNGRDFYRQSDWYDGNQTKGDPYDWSKEYIYESRRKWDEQGRNTWTRNNPYSKESKSGTNWTSRENQWERKSSPSTDSQGTTQWSSYTYSRRP